MYTYNSAFASLVNILSLWFYLRGKNTQEVRVQEVRGQVVKAQEARHYYLLNIRDATKSFLKFELKSQVKPNSIIKSKKGKVTR